MPRAVSSRRHGRRNRRQFCYILLHRGSRIKLITRLFYRFILNPVNTPVPDPFGRGSPRLIGCIHRYHAVGGAKSVYDTYNTLYHEKKSFSQMNQFLSSTHVISQSLVMVFFVRLRVPTRHCDLVVPADWGWGHGNKYYK